VAIIAKTELATLIEGEFAAVREFAKLLKQEQDTLVKGDIDVLTHIAAQKLALINQLTDYAQRRGMFLSSAGLSPNREGMQDWFRKNRDMHQTEATWNRLLEVGKSAQQLNRTNGVLINSRLRHNQKALALLQSSFQSVDLYGPDGQNSATGAGRTLGTV
jgi:flagellar biosynthesis protein FlgN